MIKNTFNPSIRDFNIVDRDKKFYNELILIFTKATSESYAHN